MDKLVATIRMLVDIYPDALHHQNAKGHTPLSLALHRRYPVKLCQILCSEAAARVESPDGLPLALLLARGIPSGCSGGAERQLLHELVRLNPSAISTVAKFGSTCLTAALTSTSQDTYASGTVGVRLVNPVDVIAFVLASHPEAADVLNDQGRFPLHMALRADTCDVNVELTVKLLATPERVTRKLANGECSLHIAAANRCSVYVLRHLHALGRISGHNLASWPSEQGLLPLHSALAAGAKDGHAQIEELYTQYPDAVVKPTADGCTCLHLCLRHKVPVETTRFILEKYPQAAAKRDGEGRVPFRTGLRNKAPLECVRLVLEANFDVISDPVLELLPFSTAREPLDGHIGSRHQSGTQQMTYLKDLADEPNLEQLPLHAGTGRVLRTSVVIKSKEKTETHYSLTGSERKSSRPGYAKSLLRLYCEHYARLNKERNNTSVVCCYAEAVPLPDHCGEQGTVQFVRNNFGILSVFAGKPGKTLSRVTEPHSNDATQTPDTALIKILTDVSELTVAEVIDQKDQKGRPVVRVEVKGTPVTDTLDDGTTVARSSSTLMLQLDTDVVDTNTMAARIRNIWQARGKANALLHTDSRGDNLLHEVCRDRHVASSCLELYIDRICQIAPATAAQINSSGGTALTVLIGRNKLSSGSLDCLLRYNPGAVKVQDETKNYCLQMICSQHSYGATGEDSDIAIKALLKAWPEAAAIPGNPLGETWSRGGGDMAGLPLHSAIRNRKSRTACKAILSAYPRAVTMLSSGGFYAAHLACMRPTGYYHKTSSSDPSLLKLCLEADKPHAATLRDCHGLVPLCHVCQNSQNGRAQDSQRVAECLTMLIQAYPDGVREMWPTRESYESVETVPTRMMLPLHAAISFGMSAVGIQLLIDAYPAGCTVPVVEHDGLQRLPLELAITSGADVKVLSLLCRAYNKAIFLPLSSRSAYPYPLHAALAHKCDISIIKELLTSEGEKQVGGAKTHRLGVVTGVYNSKKVEGMELARVPDQHGRLPLHIALQFRSKSAVVQCVLRAYPDALKHADNAGLLPAQLALQLACDAKVSLDLIQKSAPVSPDGTYDRSLLHWACREAYDQAFIEQLAEFDALGSEAASTAEKSGELPLHCLVSRNHSLKDEKKGFALLEHVLAMYPEAVSTTDGKGRYPLHLAVARNQPRIVMKLLKLFPDAAATADSDGRYPLHHCIAADNLDGEQTMHVATLLMDHDPQNTALMAADSEGMYPYFIAMGTRGKNGEDADSVASFLREKGSP